MKAIKETLALGLIVAMLSGAGNAAFAEGEVTADVPEISFEQPKAEEPKAEKSKAEKPRSEEPKAEFVEPEILEEPAMHKTKPDDAQAPAQEQASDAIEIGSEHSTDNGRSPDAVPSGETSAAERPAPTEQPAATAQPDEEGRIAAEAEELTTIEDEMTPLAIRPATPFDGTVRIFSSTDSPAIGEHVKLTSELKGFKGDYSLLFQWQINKGDGWRNISGANGRDFEFTYTERVQGCSWRLSVTIDE